MKKRNGFTLIELLSVIAILAVISVIAYLGISSILRDSEENMFRNNIRMVFEAIELELVQDPSRMPVGNVKDLRLREDAFISGTWSYHPDEQKIMLYGVKTKNYQIVGDLSSHRKQDKFPIERNDKNTWPDIEYPKLIDNIYKNVKSNNDKCVKISDKEYQDCYFKGNNLNNNIYLSGRLWNVVGINNDGTVKIVTAHPDSTVRFSLESVTDAGNIYKNPKNNFSISHVKEWLNTVFYNSLNEELQSLIVPTNWNLRALDENHNLVDVGYKDTSKVGLISLEEVRKASTKGCPIFYPDIDCYNNNYLVSKTTLSLITPMFPDSEGRGEYTACSGGVDNYCGRSPVTGGVRPTVNINVGLAIIGGDGSVNTPYTVKNDKVIKTLGDVNIGEYVNVKGHKFRAIEKQDGVVKLMDMEVVGSREYDVANNKSNKYFNPSSQTNIAYYLNNEYDKYNDIKDRLKEASFAVKNHSLIVGEADKIERVKVGLVNIEDLFSSDNNGINTDYWLMSSEILIGPSVKFAIPYYYNFSNSNNEYLLTAASPDTADKYGIRSVIALDKKEVITAGNGKIKTPHIIE